VHLEQAFCAGQPELAPKIDQDTFLALAKTYAKLCYLS
jgi:hypothetical protein